MKKRKFKVLLSLFLGAAVMFAGCSSGGDDDDGGKSSVNYDVSGTAALPEIAENQVIRNKVVNLNGSASVYYEYLTFTSETGGDYSVYEEKDGTKSKINKIPGTETPLPSSFEYDKTTGKFTAGENSSYMFNAKKDGKDICALASEILVTEAENKNTLLNKWKSEKDGYFTFDNSGYVFVNNNAFCYSNNNGWILITDSVPLYWAKQGDNFSLYYYVFQTERECVEEAGRMLGGNAIFFESNKFLLID